MSAPGHLLLDRPDDFRARMTENKRTMPREVVQDTVAVHVVLGRALGVGVIELERVLAARVVRNAVREEGAGRFVHLCGLGVKFIEALFD